MADGGTSSRAAITDMSSKTFGAVLAHIYEGGIESGADLVDLLVAASRLQVASLVRLAAATLMQRLDADNVVDVWATASSLMQPELESKATRHAMRHFVSMSQGAAWLRAPRGLVLSLLRSDTLATTRGEADVYAAACAWLRAQPAASLPAEHVLDVLRAVRFAMLPAATMREVAGRSIGQKVTA